MFTWRAGQSQSDSSTIPHHAFSQIAWKALESQMLAANPLQKVPNLLLTWLRSWAFTRPSLLKWLNAGEPGAPFSTLKELFIW